MRTCAYCPAQLTHGNQRQCGSSQCASRWRAEHRTRQTKPHPLCTLCGKVLQYARLTEPVCRSCWPSVHRSRKQRPYYRSAKAKAARAARGTAGKRVWTQGPCNWCGDTFASVGVGAARWCSETCKRRASKERRQTLEYGGTGWRWSDFMRIARRFEYACAYCGQRPDRLDPDHVVPLSRGGVNAPSNLLPACLSCNSDKRDLSLPDWNVDRTRRGLAPRRTTWAAGDSRYWHLALETAHHVAA